MTSLRTTTLFYALLATVAGAQPAAHAEAPTSDADVLRLREVIDSCSLMRWMMSAPPESRPLESTWGSHRRWATWATERASFELTFFLSHHANGSTKSSAAAPRFDDLLDAEIPERWQLAFAPWNGSESAAFTLSGLAPADDNTAWLEFDPESGTAILLDPNALTVLAFDLQGRLRWKHSLPRSISLFDNPVRRPPGYSRETEWNVQTYWQLRQSWDLPSFELKKSVAGRVRYELEFSWGRFRIDVQSGFLECIPRRGNVPQLQQRHE